jgi:predicted nucleic acid-binding protein
MKVIIDTNVIISAAWRDGFLKKSFFLLQAILILNG